MKKKILLIVAIFIAMSTVTANAINISLISFQQRMALNVARQMIPDKESKYDYYVSKDYVDFQGSEKQLVFVDMMPRAGWEHPCKYVYVDPNNISQGNSVVVDATCPPKGVRLLPAVKKNGTAADLVDIKMEQGPENKAAKHTYAVIVSGGKDKESNSSRYWNDCSFIYKTLTTYYRVPKSNVKVLMSDGTDPAEDMSTELGGNYFSSPLDLDGDGNADIGYAASKANVKSVLESVTAKLGDGDHLFVFFTDHGGYDKVRKQSYLCLWNGDTLYPDELNEYLSHGDAGYISVLMGQCHSGGFSEALKSNNRIIMTACAENELSYACEEDPFDEFVYRWTCAISGSDGFGNAVDAGLGNASATLLRAYDYACKTDIYANGDNPYAVETPSVSLLRNSTAEDLTMALIPDVVDLYITRGEMQTTDSLSLSTMVGRVGFQKYYQDERSKPFWDSSDIWARHTDDGLTNHTHDSGCLDENSNTFYIYVNVRNRGVKTYNSNKMVLKTYWARSSMKIQKGVWLGNVSDDAEIVGHTGGWNYIKNEIPAGGSAIECRRITFVDGDLDIARQKDFNFCILAYLTNRNNDNFEVDDLLIPAVWNTNKLAQKNLTTIMLERQADIDSLDSMKPMYPSVIAPSDWTCRAYRLRLLPSKDTEKQLGDLRITLSVPEGSVKEWTPVMKDNLVRTAKSTDLTKVVMNDKLMVDDIVLTGDKACAIKIDAAVNASTDLPDNGEYKFNLALYDADSDLLLGGEAYKIKRGPRKKIDFTVNKSLNSGKYELSATGASEKVEYKWYDNNGELVATGMTCNVPANLTDGSYTVVASALSDNAYCEKTVTVSQISKITDVVARPDGYVVARFNSPVGKNASLQIAPADGTIPAVAYEVEEGSTVSTIYAGTMKSGIYQLNLIEDGKVSENKKFMKK